MKIAHIVCTYPPYYGGMGNVVFQTIEELRRRGHDAQVITPLYGGGEEDKQLEHVKRMAPQLSFGNAARMGGLPKELETMDLVHLHYPFFGTANLVRKWKLKNPQKPLVVTYHMDTRAPSWKGLIFKLYAKYWMPKIMAVADVIIGSSQDYIAHSTAAPMLEQYPSKWQFIPFGVDTLRFREREKPEAVFEKHELDIGLSTVVFVGGMDQAHYFKGVPVLLQALRRLHKEGKQIQALFVGEGDMRGDFEVGAQVLGLSGFVKFAGSVSQDELPYYYNAGDICALPSTTNGEAFGMVLLESMASGVPVVASDLPGVRQVARHGGVVVPPGDAMALAQALSSILSGEITFESIRAEMEAHYSWGVVTDTLEDIYKKLVG